MGGEGQAAKVTGVLEPEVEQEELADQTQHL